MDFFSATRSHSAAPAPLDAAAAGHGAARAALGPVTTLDEPTTAGVDAFAEAINARYSRAGTSLIPLSPNQLGSTSTTTPPYPPEPTDPPLPFALTMPTKAHPPPAPVLSLHPPPLLAARPSPFAMAASGPLAPPPPPFKLAPPTSSSTASASSPSAPSASSQAPLPPSAFTALQPNALPPVLADAAVLILDIRPHNAYALGRLPSALSLSVPSTLLKRPLFSLDRLAQMLSPGTRTRFAAWPSASKIVVYDADSASLAEGGNILGLLRKLRKEGFKGELCWVKGGYKAIWKEQFQLVDQSAPAEEEDEDGELLEPQSAPGQPRPSALGLPGDMSRTSSAPATTASFPLNAAGAASALRTTHLPMQAFMSSTTTSQRPFRSGAHTNVVPPTPMPTRADPFAALGAAPSGSMPGAMTSSSSLPGTSSKPAQSFALRLPLGNAAMSTESIPEGKVMHAFPPRLGATVIGGGMDTASSLPTQGAGAAYGMVPRERPHYKSFPGVGALPGDQPVAFNPFFDTIRQNLELGGGRGSGEGIPLKLSRKVKGRIEDLPFEWLKEIARRSGQLTDETPSDKEEKPLVAVKPVDAKPRHVESDASDSDAEADTRRRQPRAPSVVEASLRARDSSPTSPASTDGEELAKTLAMQFYRIELSEQRRLMGVMKHHSMESTLVEGSSAHRAKPSAPMSKSATVGGYATNSSGIPTGGLCGPVVPTGTPVTPTQSTKAVDRPGQTYTGTAAARMLSNSVSESGVESGPRNVKDREKAFPYSITAGVEKGDKNRYRNIWPFEHARVRLHKSRPDEDDYMNASYVQPLGTTKRYIATQGPLPATFTDFWTLCWQENVHVIVMLTREVESALVKCGNYWKEGEYGPLRLKLISTSDTPESERRRQEREMSSGFFNVPQARTAQPTTPEETTIRRVFELTHTGYPAAPPRRITQLQYLDWPDLDVPKDPRGLLQLMQEVDEIVERSRCEGERVWGEGPLRRKADAKRVITPPREKPASGDEDDELDPRTGVAKHAIRNPPVLLHCSAGVGRTGGFIAVDAVLDGVRREMRKRREKEQLPTGASSPERPSGSQSPIEQEGDEAMEVDVDRSSTSASPPLRSSDEYPTAGDDRQGSTTSLLSTDKEASPLSDGPGQPEAMEVDAIDFAKPQPASPRQLQNRIQPSRELISEVRRAHHNQLSSQATPSPLQKGPLKNVSLPRVTSPASTTTADDSAGSSSRRSTSISAISSADSPMGSVPSSQTGSTQSLTAALAKTSAGDQKARSSSEGSKAGSVDSHTATQRSEPLSQMAVDDVKAAHTAEPSRLDTWRSGVSDTSRHHTTDAHPNIERIQIDKNMPTPRTMVFDYATPRPLHDDASPPLLSTYDEPIRRVIEDMREQRMSLCQSLRQYVFVHRAIIQGALMIVDAERREADEAEKGMPVDASREASAEMADVQPTGGDGKIPGARRASLTLGVDKGGDLVAAVQLPGPRAPAPLEDVPMGEQPSALQPSPGLPSPRSKRQASPTELVHEGLGGELRLMKRPSVKRKGRSSDDGEGGSLRLNAMVLSSPPPPGDR